MYSFKFPIQSKLEEAKDYIHGTILDSKANNLRHCFKLFTDVDYAHIAGLLLLDQPEADRWTTILDADESNGNNLAIFLAKMLTDPSPDPHVVIDHFSNSLSKHFSEKIDELISDAFNDINPASSNEDRNYFNNLSIALRG